MFREYPTTLREAFSLARYNRDRDEDIGVDEISNAKNGIFDIGESNEKYGSSKFGEFLENKESVKEVFMGGCEVKENQEKDKNRIKTGQKREECRSREKFKAVAVEIGRKTKENKKRMVENAYTVKKLCKFKEKKKRKGQSCKY
nr:hypothetical protein [Tanacetum cinerariifolium]